MIGKLNHIAIAVPKLEVAAAKYRDQLGAVVGQPQALPEHGVTVVFVDTGNSKVELLEPLGESSPIRAFLEKNPMGGMHHMCFEVPDLAAAIGQLQLNGARVLGDGNPRMGAHGLPVVFLHPKDFDGVLIELEECQPAGT
jgi:methylmalonyl-CoA/ethylmalonyl-CoA epimerase